MGRTNRDFPTNPKERLEVLKRFGKRLAEVRSKKSITQENLAFEIGVDRTYISYIERGERNPSIYVLSKIAKALRVDSSELLPF